MLHYLPNCQMLTCSSHILIPISFHSHTYFFSLSFLCSSSCCFNVHRYLLFFFSHSLSLIPFSSLSLNLSFYPIIYVSFSLFQFLSFHSLSPVNCIFLVSSFAHLTTLLRQEVYPRRHENVNVLMSPFAPTFLSLSN
jgi:hypothetical protein